MFEGSDFAKGRLGRFCPQRSAAFAAQIRAGIVACWLILCSPLAQAAGGQPIYVLDQEVPALGPVRFVVKADAFHFFCLNLGYEAVCKAPDWQIVIFNAKAKVYVKRNLGDLIESGFIPGKWTPQTLRREEVIGHGRYMGRGHVVYAAKQTHKAGEHHTTTSLSGLDLGRRAVSWEQWQMEDQAVDSHIGEAMGIITHVQIGPGVPIANFSFFDNGDRAYNLKTHGLRPAAGAELKIEYPPLTGYRKLATVQEVCFANKKTDITNFFEDIGIGEDFGGKSKDKSKLPDAVEKK